MCQGKFIYILDPQDFNTFMKRGILKYIPDKMLLLFSKRIKPRILYSLMRDGEDSVQGYVAGIFLTYKNLKKEEYISQLIYAVDLIKKEDITSIIIENAYTLSQNDIEEIESKLGLKILDGREQIIASTLYVLEKISDLRNQKLNEKEILIISDDTVLTEKLVLDMARKTKYLTIMSKDKMFSENLGKNVLNSTGLSLSSIVEINKSIHKFDIVINLAFDVVLDIYKIKRRAVVIDASIGRKLESLIEKKRIDIFIISDFLYRNMRTFKVEQEVPIFKKEVPSYIYEGIHSHHNYRPVAIKVNGKTYKMKEAVDIYFGRRQNRTVFEAKSQ